MIARLVTFDGAGVERLLGEYVVQGKSRGPAGEVSVRRVLAAGASWLRARLTSARRGVPIA